MLKVHVDESGKVAVLHLQGNVVRGPELSVLRHAIFSKADTGIMVLDLTMVNLIDAGGLGALLELREWSLAKGIELLLENPNKLVANVLSITCLDSVFKMSFDLNASSARELPRISSCAVAATGA